MKNFSIFGFLLTTPIWALTLQIASADPSAPIACVKAAQDARLPNISLSELCSGATSNAPIACVKAAQDARLPTTISLSQLCRWAR